MESGRGFITLNRRGLVPNGLHTSDGPAVDAVACGLGVSRESPDSTKGERQFVAPNGRGLVPNGLHTSDGPAVDAVACGLGVSRESPDSMEGGRGFVTPNGRELIPNGLHTSDGPAVDAMACGLGVSRESPDSTEGRRGFLARNGRGLVPNVLNTSDGPAVNAVACGLGVSRGSLGNMENGRGLVPAETSSRYDLRKRPRVVAHRMRVEEEPMDSTDPVSYREAIEHLRQWSEPRLHRQRSQVGCLEGSRCRPCLLVDQQLQLVCASCHASDVATLPPQLRAEHGDGLDACHHEPSAVGREEAYLASEPA